jgi:hypothetical protein
MAGGDNNIISLVGGDTCSYYAQPSDNGCNKPRTCYDCLNVNVQGERKGCMLSFSGFCQSMQYYNPKLDYRRNHTKSKDNLNQFYTDYFPASNTSYCEKQDVACEVCYAIATRSSLKNKITDAQINQTVSDNQRFCTGKNGCICLAACESPRWEIEMQQDCDRGGSFGSFEVQSAHFNSLLPVLMVLQVALLAVFLYRRNAYNRGFGTGQAHAEGPYNNVNAISSPSNRLQLSGWRQMQDDLIRKEREGQLYVNILSPKNHCSNNNTTSSNNRRDTDGNETDSFSLPVMIEDESSFASRCDASTSSEAEAEGGTDIIGDSSTSSSEIEDVWEQVSSPRYRSPQRTEDQYKTTTISFGSQNNRL